jgi:hypothetical protein
MNNFSERTEMLLPEPARALGALLGVPVQDLARLNRISEPHARGSPYEYGLPAGFTLRDNIGRASGPTPAKV